MGRECRIAWLKEQGRMCLSYLSDTQASQEKQYVPSFHHTVSFLHTIAHCLAHFTLDMLALIISLINIFADYSCQVLHFQHKITASKAQHTQVIAYILMEVRTTRFLTIIEMLPSVLVLLF
jgi:hypothetical protein